MKTSNISNHSEAKRGFTLVEIMIVVVIIGLLAAMAIPAFNKVTSASRASTMAKALKEFREAAVRYDFENGFMPADAAAMSDELPKAWNAKPPLAGTWAYTDTGDANGTIEFIGSSEIEEDFANRVDEILDDGDTGAGQVTVAGSTITYVIYDMD
ncbi:MAG: type II secretion system protein [Puniceicoccales bacterium]